MRFCIMCEFCSSKLAVSLIDLYMTFEAPTEAFISSQKFRNSCGVFPCSNSDLYHLLHYEDVKYAQNCL